MAHSQTSCSTESWFLDLLAFAEPVEVSSTAVPIRPAWQLRMWDIYIMVLSHLLGPSTIKDHKKNELLTLLWSVPCKGRHFTGIGQGGAYREASLYPGTNRPSSLLYRTRNDLIFPQHKRLLYTGVCYTPRIPGRDHCIPEINYVILFWKQNQWSAEKYELKYIFFWKLFPVNLDFSMYIINFPADSTDTLSTTKWLHSQRDLRGIPYDLDKLNPR